MTNIGYWTPLPNPENKLIYLLAYPSREARAASWKGFLADPDWKKAAAESETNGKIVSKVEARFMTATDFSPEFPQAAGGTERLFDFLAEILKKDYGVREFLRVRKADATRPVSPEMLASISGADVILSAIGD